jgi:tRNA uridine 5-carboxymethylaminomethyl modification enzyme
MWTFPETYDVIVIGAGHAGCEAAHASARMGATTLLLTMNLDTIAKMSCNPAIGGTAKGHIVREIDALGGIMGKVADETGIQFRMLNASKGPAVWSPRAQADKFAYQTAMKRRLERVPHLFIKQGTIETLLIEKGCIIGVGTLEGIVYLGRTVVISSGTFMRGMLHIGQTNYEGGRAGDKPSVGLSKCLEEIGFRLGRLKTGTPPRIHRRSIDFSMVEEQPGESGIRFSYDEPEGPGLRQVPCHITYTTEATKEIIQQNIHRSPLYSGKIKGVGPRYCPSIEDKVIRFADKERHQIFLEPEGLDTDEIYANGISSSLPFDVQFAMLHTVKGLEKAEIMRPAYAIEYDYVKSGQLYISLETKLIEGLFFAGQINGTTGYEEAAGQGLIAGINAARKAAGQTTFTLKRSEAYIGVMIDELISKDLDEPYRMFTSRAEHRLLLRQDNADLRLRHYGYELGLIDQPRFEKLQQKKEAIEQGKQTLNKKFVQKDGKTASLAQLLARPEMTYDLLQNEFSLHIPDLSQDVRQQIELEIKYAGYIERQENEVRKLLKIEEIGIPIDFDYSSIIGLSNEAREKLRRFTPATLGQAARINGVSPADISILMVALKGKSQSSKEKEKRID